MLPHFQITSLKAAILMSAWRFLFYVQEKGAIKHQIRPRGIPSISFIITSLNILPQEVQSAGAKEICPI
jgi:hypothetical protein